MLTDYLRMIKGFILFIGPQEAGKTSILRRLVTGKFEEHDPTLGFREETVAKVRIIEIGGQENFREYWFQALKQNPVHIFFTIDVTKRSNFTEYKEFITDSQVDLSAKNQEVTLIINKMDLVENIPNYIPKHHLSIQSSAKTGEGFLDILERIANFEKEAEANIRFDDDIWNTEDKKTNEIDVNTAEDIVKNYEGKF